MISKNGLEVAAAKDYAGDFPHGAPLREAFIAGILWERAQEVQRRRGLMERPTQEDRELTAK